MRLGLVVLLAGVTAAGVASAQQIVSAHAGVVHFTEGKVYVGDKLVQSKFGVFPDLGVGEVLRTEDGRAEVLLTPGAFLRVDQYSSIKMLSRDLLDTRFEVVGGSVMVECDEIAKGASLNVVYKDRTMQLERHGLYRLDATTGEFRVYDGRAVVEAGDDQLELRRGKQADVNGVLVAEKFNPKTSDEFYAWNGMRSGYISSANISAANSAYYGGTHLQTNAWLWDPWYGSYTFIPTGGVMFNPFGWSFWSPAMVIFAPAPVYTGYSPGGANGGMPAASTSSSSSTPRGPSSPAAGARPGGFGGGSSAPSVGGFGGGIGAMSGGRVSGGGAHR